jgi:hypothetical protein
MAATIIDSKIFGDIFSDARMRAVWSDENRTAKYLDIERALAKAAPQLGSVGGGNHFVELQCDRDTGEVWVMVHCGSRGFGWQTADWFFKAGAELRGLPAGRREEAWLRVDEPLGRQYWAHHNAAANYAVANRHTIVLGVQEATEAVYARRPEVFFEISHNLVQEETLVLPDGATMLCVHPEGHGKGPIVLQRSTDAGRTWSAPLPVPENWATSQETPTIHRLVDRHGNARLVLFSGLHPIRRALSNDDGANWTSYTAASGQFFQKWPQFLEQLFLGVLTVTIG